MSYILEALKRSQLERERGRVPTLASVPQAGLDRRPPSAWPWWWGLLGVATLGITAYTAIQLHRPPPEPAAVLAQSPTGGTPAGPPAGQPSLAGGAPQAAGQPLVTPLVTPVPQAGGLPLPMLADAGQAPQPSYSYPQPGYVAGGYFPYPGVPYPGYYGALPTTQQPLPAGLPQPGVTPMVYYPMGPAGSYPVPGPVPPQEPVPEPDLSDVPAVPLAPRASSASTAAASSIGNGSGVPADLRREVERFRKEMAKEVKDDKAPAKPKTSARREAAEPPAAEVAPPPPPVAASAPPSPSTAAPSGDRPGGVGELPMSLQAKIPSQRLTAHVYGGESSARFVIYNSQRLAEGGRSKEGLTVKEIMAEGAVMEFEGQRFFVPR